MSTRTMDAAERELAEAQTIRLDDDGQPIVETATCGTCGRSWNDAAISGRTPTPSGRCPFEADHAPVIEVVTECSARLTETWHLQEPEGWKSMTSDQKQEAIWEALSSGDAQIVEERPHDEEDREIVKGPRHA